MVTAVERLQWALHPRRSELPLGVRIEEQFKNGARPGLGCCCCCQKKQTDKVTDGR